MESAMAGSSYDAHAAWVAALAAHYQEKQAQKEPGVRYSAFKEFKAALHHKKYHGLDHGLD